MQSAGEVTVARQELQHALATIAGITNRMKLPPFAVTTEDPQQVDGQFRTRAVDATMPLGGCMIQVQAKQHGQCEDSLWPASKAYDHRQHNPAMSPVHQRCLARRDQGVVMHARAEHLKASLASQRVIESQEDLAVGQICSIRLKTTRPTRSSDQLALANSRWNAE
jgi:hypothetical protein